MDHMCERLVKRGVASGGDGLFDVHKVALRLMQVEAAAAQGNCSLALRLLKATQKVGGIFIYVRLFIKFLNLL